MPSSAAECLESGMPCSPVMRPTLLWKAWVLTARALARQLRKDLVERAHQHLRHILSGHCEIGLSICGMAERRVGNSTKIIRSWEIASQQNRPVEHGDCAAVVTDLHINLTKRNQA